MNIETENLEWRIKRSTYKNGKVWFSPQFNYENGWQTLAHRTDTSTIYAFETAVEALSAIEKKKAQLKDAMAAPRYETPTTIEYINVE